MPPTSYKFGTITPEIISFVGGKPKVIKKRRRSSGSRRRSAARAMASLKEAERKAKELEEKKRLEAEKKAREEKKRLDNIYKNNKIKNIIIAEAKKNLNKKIIISVLQKKKIIDILKKQALDKSNKLMDIRKAMRIKKYINDGYIYKALSYIADSFKDVSITGGVTRDVLNVSQENLNMKVEEFNKKYGGKELNKNEWLRASGENNNLYYKQKEINKKDDKFKRSVMSFLSRENLLSFGRTGIIPWNMTNKLEPVEREIIYYVGSVANDEIITIEPPSPPIPPEPPIENIPPKTGHKNKSKPKIITPTKPKKYSTPYKPYIHSGYSNNLNFKKPISSSNIKIIILPRAIIGYYIVIKKNGKNVKVRLPLLTLNDAIDIAAYKLDNTLARTCKLVKSIHTRRVGVIPIKIKGYFNKHRKKFRIFSMKYGKKIQLNMAFIERNKYICDTTGEKRQLQEARKKKFKSKKLIKNKGLKKTSQKKPLPKKRKLTKKSKKKTLQSPKRKKPQLKSQKKKKLPKPKKKKN